MINEDLEQQFMLQEYKKLDMESKLHGTVLQKLPAVKHIWSNDLFLISRPSNQSKLSSDRNILNDYFEGRFRIKDESLSGPFIIDENSDTYFSAPRQSYAIRYADLCAGVLADTYLNINVGSMAREQSIDYAFKEHNHDDIYSNLSAKSYYPIEDDNYWHLGTLRISSYTESGQLNVKTVEFNCPAPKMPTFKDPDIGEIRFIVQNQLTSYDVKQYGESYNIDIYSDDFDGWVYPNGTVFTTEQPVDFIDAKETYGVDENSFQVPDLRHFIKLNPGSKRSNALKFYSYQNGLVKHKHEIEDFSCAGNIEYDSMEINCGYGIENQHTGGVACGYGVPSMPIEGRINVSGSGELTNARFSGISSLNTDESLDIESKPVHNLMPIMVFIGRQYRQEA